MRSQASRYRISRITFLAAIASGIYLACIAPLMADCSGGATIDNTTIICFGSNHGAVAGGVNNTVVNNGSSDGTLGVGLIGTVENNGTVSVIGNGILGRYFWQEQDEVWLVEIDALAMAGGIESDVINNGNISVSSDWAEAAAMLGLDFASVINSPSGTITASGTGTLVFGMLGAGSGQGVLLLNQGTIDMTGTFMEGMVAVGTGLITNEGDVTIDGFSAAGLYGVNQDADDTIIITNDGSVTMTGDDSSAVWLEGNGSISNNASIETSGFGAEGIDASTVIASQSIEILNSSSSTIIASGFGAEGIGVSGTGTATISSDGQITMQGEDSVGIQLTGSGSVANGGSIFTDGLNSEAILVEDDNAEISNTSSGVINTLGDGSVGIDLQGSGTITSDGSVTSTGDGSIGIWLAGDGSVSNTGTVAIDGEDAWAIYGIAGASKSIKIENKGLVFAFGKLSGGLGLEGAGSITNSGSVTAGGVSGFGIGALGDDMVVTNDSTGNVVTNALESMGIAVDGSNANITNNGEIQVNQGESFGILVQGDDATIRTGTSSSIKTAGTNSPGITAQGDFAEITNGNVIETTGIRSPGIFIYGIGIGPNVTNEGDISTTGNSSPGISLRGVSHHVRNEFFSFISTTGTDSAGIQIGSLNDPSPISEVFNAGAITTGAQGSNSQGISIFGDNSKVTNDATGSILTKGTSAHGIYIQGDNAELTNAGSIRTTGSDAIGIKLGDPGSTPIMSAKVSALGNIETKGINAHGIMVFAEAAPPTFPASPQTQRSLDTGGTIKTQLANASGIYVDGSDWFINNNAEITTGGAGAHGISVLADDSILSTTANITTIGSSAHGVNIVATFVATINSGTIRTEGRTAHGINLEGDAHPVFNKGPITVTGPVSYGIHAAGNNININNSNIITATSGTSAAIDLATQSGQVSTLTNERTGVLSNSQWSVSNPFPFAIQGGEGDDTVNNSGTINGAIDLRSGNDTLVLKHDSQISGISDGGGSVADNDVLIADIDSGDPTLHIRGDNFVNFEEFSKKGSGTAFLNGTLTSEKAYIESGRLQVQSTGVLDVSETLIWGPVPGDHCNISTCLVMNGGELRSSMTLVGAGGSLWGNGTIANPEGLFSVDGGWIGSGFSTGTLAIDGDFQFISGLLEMEANSLFDTDEIIVGGDFTITNGLIEVMLGFTPNPEDVLEFFMIAGTTNIPVGYNPIVGIAAAGSGVPLGTQFTVDIGGELFGGVVTSAVPLPASAWLLGSALGLLVWIRRRNSVPAA